MKEKLVFGKVPSCVWEGRQVLDGTQRMASLCVPLCLIDSSNHFTTFSTNCATEYRTFSPLHVATYPAHTEVVGARTEEYLYSIRYRTCLFSLNHPSLPQSQGNKHAYSLDDGPLLNGSNITAEDVL